MVERELFT
ncbi:hypothetical protein D018_0161A, partial [Vibrio parahaemolyticus VP2007-007]